MAILHQLLALASVTHFTGVYELKAKYDASNFFAADSFRFHEGNDATTHGLAEYVSKDEAMPLKLANTDGGKVFLRVDTVTTLQSTIPGPGNGRKSVRLEGVAEMSTGLVIADFDHLPAGACGQWPAFWLLREDVDQGNTHYSEIDIIEGVSLQNFNQITLFTRPDACVMKDNGGTGTTRKFDCLAGNKNKVGDDVGCGVNAPAGTFGSPFNQHKGGIWAVQVEAEGIKAWFFPHDGNVPSDALGANPDPSAWGKPVMNFAPATCNIKTAFQRMRIVFNITFCGSYAGAWNAWHVYTNCAKTAGVSSCKEYVAKNPGAFKDVYFSINSVKVFQQSGVEGADASTTERLTPASIFGEVV